MKDSQYFENIHFSRSINTIASVPDSFPMHWHKYVEVIALPLDANPVKSPVVQIQQTQYRMQPGDVVFIWSGELHELSDNDERSLIGLQFAATIVSDLPEFVPLTSKFRAFHHVRHADTPSLAEEVLLYLKQMILLQKGTGRFRDVESLIVLLEMFMSFGKYIENNINHRNDEASAGVIKLAEKMNAACNYIAENCERDLSLEDVAEYVGFSSCYFSRVFKQATDYSFVEYLTLQRVKNAQALLADSNVSITEVSYQSGFRSISTFNRVFRQYKGCSPSEYRKYYLV